MNREQSTYLTVITWPRNLGRDARAQLISRAAGLDEYTSRLRVATEPPVIVGVFPTETAERAVAQLCSKGGDGLAVSLDDLAKLGGTLKVKDLSLENGRLHAVLWRGEPVWIEPRDIEVVIRARISETKPQTMSSPMVEGVAAPMLRNASFAVGGAYGAALAFRAAYEGAMLERAEQSYSVSDKLDFHVRDGRVFQIDGDKFAYRILGDLRGYSDKSNMDGMCELLTHLAPGAVVDPYFSLWKPPSGYRRLRLPQMFINQDDPAFAFYSRWMAMVYRRLTATPDNG